MLMKNNVRRNGMDWESFIAILNDGKVVPVIGNDLIKVKDEDGKLVPLCSYFGREVTRILKIPYIGQSLGELALAHQKENIMMTTEAIFHKMDEDMFNFDPLVKLAEITDFKFFVSTTLDGLLVKVLCKARTLKKNQVKVINYSLQDLDNPPREEEEEPQVTVFNLFGSFEEGNILKPAFNEEEMLEQIFSLSRNDERHPLANHFITCLVDKLLLFIGCDFPDWFMRFIIRIVTNERYKDRSLGDYIVWSDIDKFPKLNKFLEQFNKNIFKTEKCHEGNLKIFIDELYYKWTDALKEQPIKYKEMVFLSYNNPDREWAKILKKRLKAKGVRNVWFDIDDLDIGKHQENIESEIRKCDIFIPLISNNSLTNTRSYTQTVEWTCIEGRLSADKYYRQSTFKLVPIIIDETERSDERIPGFMREFAIWNLQQDQERIFELLTGALTPI
jgi:hypothetical protein